MSRSKASQTKIQAVDIASGVSHVTAVTLLKAGIFGHCLDILRTLLLKYWKALPIQDDGEPTAAPSPIGGVLLRRRPYPNPVPDMSPFFLRQYVKEHAHDVFAEFPQLLTELAIRMPHQIKKIITSVPVTDQENRIELKPEWFFLPCQYMETQQASAMKRPCRKLLMSFCVDKEKYRQLRDFHSIQTHMEVRRASTHQSDRFSHI
jgi:E3 ubiquitin-protein ligase UBR4